MNSSRRAFTLIELMIVVAIISVIAAMALPAIADSRRSANEARVLGYMKTLATAQQMYHRRNDRYAGAPSFAPGLLPKVMSDVGLIPAAWRSVNIGIPVAAVYGYVIKAYTSGTRRVPLSTSFAVDGFKYVEYDNIGPANALELAAAGIIPEDDGFWYSYARSIDPNAIGATSKTFYTDSTGVIRYTPRYFSWRFAAGPKSPAIGK